MQRSQAMEYLLWTCAVVCGASALITFAVHDNTGAAAVIGAAGMIIVLGASAQRTRRLKR